LRIPKRGLIEDSILVMMFLTLIALSLAPARAYVTLITDGGLNAWNDMYTPTPPWYKVYSENYKIFRTTYPRTEGTYAAVINSNDASSCTSYNSYYQYLTQFFSKNVQTSNGQWLDARAKIYKDPNRQNCQVLYVRGHDASRGITWYAEIWLDTITNNVHVCWYDPSTGNNNLCGAKGVTIFWQESENMCVLSPPFDVSECV
jgi:hypothetical protein